MDATITLTDNMILYSEDGFCRAGDLLDYSGEAYLLSNKHRYVRCTDITRSYKGTVNIEMASGNQLQIGQRNSVLVEGNEFKAISYLVLPAILTNFEYVEQPVEDLEIDLEEITDRGCGEIDLGSTEFARVAGRYLYDNKLPAEYKGYNSIVMKDVLSTLFGDMREKFITDELLFGTSKEWVEELFKSFGRGAFSGLTDDLRRGLSFLNIRVQDARVLKENRFARSQSTRQHLISEVNHLPPYKETTYTLTATNLEKDEGIVVNGYIIQ